MLVDRLACYQHADRDRRSYLTGLLKRGHRCGESLPLRQAIRNELHGLVSRTKPRHPPKMLSFLQNDSIEVTHLEVKAIPTPTVRNLPDAVHRALRVRAAANGRSTEAEVRDILEDTVAPSQRLRLGDALAALERAHGLTNAEVDTLELTRDSTPAAPMGFDA